MINSRNAFIYVFLVRTLLPTAAGAQDFYQSFGQLQRALEPNQLIVVTDETGQKTKGRVVSVSDSSLTLQVKATTLNPQGRQTFTDNTVSTIARADSLVEGTLIGLGVGAAVTWGFVRYHCGPPGYDAECAAQIGALGALTFVPAGAVLGALSDKAILTPFFFSHGTSFVRVSPWVGGRSSGGLAVSLGF
jgi:hypothetical protein